MGTNHDEDTQHLKSGLEALWNQTQFDYYVKNKHVTSKNKIMKVLTLQPELFYTIVHFLPIWGFYAFSILFTKNNDFLSSVKA